MQSKPTSVLETLDMFKQGKLAPALAESFKKDVIEGNIILPEYEQKKIVGSISSAPKQEKFVVPRKVVEAYNSGKMDFESQRELEEFISTGQGEAPGIIFKSEEEIQRTSPSIVDKVGTMARGIKNAIGAGVDVITGSSKETETTRSLPNIEYIPELRQFTKEGLASILGQYISAPDEAVQIIQTNFPGVKTRKDEKGNLVVRSSIDGQEYAVKPGFRQSDIPFLTTSLLSGALTGTGGALMQGGKALALGAAREMAQGAIGGEIDPEAPLIEGAIGAAVPAISKTVSGISEVVPKAVKKAAKSLIPKPLLESSIPEKVQEKTLKEDIVPIARRAVNVFGSQGAKKELASEVKIDKAVAKAAKELGVFDDLQPGHMSSNQAFVQLDQAIKSQPASALRQDEISRLKEVGQKAVNLMKEIGADQDLSSLEKRVKDGMQSTIDSISSNEKVAFDKLREMIPSNTRVQANKLAKVIQKKLDDVGGNPKDLGGLYKNIYESLKRDDFSPTYGKLDDIRAYIGESARGKGPFKDAATGEAKMFYKTIWEDMQEGIKDLGIGNEIELANTLTKTRKGIESDMATLLGKRLDSSLVPSLKSSPKTLRSGNVSEFAKLINAIPKEMRQAVTSSAILQTFGEGTANGPLNFKSFSDFFDGLKKNKQAYNMVMANLPKGAAKRLENLAIVSKSVANATKEFIATGKSQNIPGRLDAPNNILQAIYRRARMLGDSSKGGGFIVAALDAFSGGKTVATEALDQLLRSIEFRSLVEEASKAGSVSEKAAKKLALSSAFKKFKAKFKINESVPDSIRWIRAASMAAPKERETVQKEEA